MLFGFVLMMMSAFSMPLLLLAEPHQAPCRAMSVSMCHPWGWIWDTQQPSAPGLGQARLLRVQGLHLGQEPSPVGSSVLPHPIPQGSAKHVPAMAYTTLPYSADSTSLQPKTSWQNHYSASSTDYTAIAARNSGLAGIKSFSHISQTSSHSSSP